MLAVLYEVQELVHELTAAGAEPVVHALHARGLVVIVVAADDDVDGASKGVGDLPRRPPMGILLSGVSGCRSYLAYASAGMPSLSANARALAYPAS